MDLRQIHTEDVFGPSLERVSVSRSNAKVKVNGNKKRAVHSHHPPAATEWSVVLHAFCNALAANNVTLQDTGPFHHCQGLISAACLRFIFGKTSLALVSRFSFVTENDMIAAYQLKSFPITITDVRGYYILRES